MTGGGGTPTTRSRAPSISGSTAGIGQAVEVQGNRGIVRFSGTTEFAPGRWFGVELEGPYGKNDGSVKGKRYFECPLNYGVFVRSSQVKILTSSSASASSRSPIRGSEIQRPSPSKISGVSPTPISDINNALKAPRRSTVLPGRIAQPASGLPSTLGSSSRTSKRLSGRISTSPSLSHPMAGGSGGGLSHPQGRRVSGIAAPNRPSMAGSRSDSRQALYGNENANYSEPSSTSQSVSNTYDDSVISERPTTPPQHAEPTTAETPRTPYRPALSMNESSLLDTSISAGTSTVMSAQTIPLKQFEELRLKYKFLEQKRSEDRQRIQEADKIRADAEQALRVREKLATKVGAQQEEMRDLKQRMKDLSDASSGLEDKYAEAMESMEMLTLDKEVAEERTDTLSQEVNSLREQLAEASTNLDVYRQEDEDGPSGDSLEYAQMKRQNERLKEALVRLRDVTADNEAQLNQKIRHLEHDIQTAQEQGAEKDVMKEKLQIAEAQIEDLKERLDDALSAEEMIESLTDRNLDLNNKVEKLGAEIEDLEALCEINNEMEETRGEHEKGLQAEVDKLNIIITDRTRNIDKLEEAVADYQYNIKQYRDLVSSLQSDLQRLREREQSQATEVASISSKTQEMMSLNLQLRSTVMKTKAKTIDLEMRRLDADQASEQLAMTEPFLPGQFFKSENDALKSLLAFRRLAFKSNLLCKQLEQDENINVGISDDFIATAEIRSRLTRFEESANLLVCFLTTCSDTEFMRLGSLLQDTQGAERRLNGLIDLLCKEEFRATEVLPEIRRLETQINGIVDSYVTSANQATAPQRLNGMVNTLAFETDIQLANLFFIEQLLVTGPAVDDQDDEDSVAAAAAMMDKVFSSRDLQRIATEVVPSITSVIQNCKASKAAAIKLLRRTGDLKNTAMVTNDRVFEQVGKLSQLSKELANYSVRSRTIIQDYFASAAAATTTSTDRDEDKFFGRISIDRLQQDLSSVAQDVFGASDAAVMGLALGASQRLTKELSVALATVSDSNSSNKLEAIEAPWVRRASQFKANLVQNSDMERQIGRLNEEIISLARELKLRDQAIQEYAVKTELLDKRTETARKLSAEMLTMQRQLESARAKEQTYEEAIESLQGEMDNMEREYRKLRQESANARSVAMAGDFSGMGGSGPLPTDLLGLRSKIGVLQESIAYLQKENAHLRAKYMYKKGTGLMALPPLVHSSASRSGNNISQPEMNEVVREAKALAREACRLAAMPKLVKLGDGRVQTKSVNSRAWTSQKSRPQFDLYRQQTLAQTLKQRAEQVQERLRSMAKISPSASTLVTVNF